MAKTDFYVDLDLNQNQLIKAVVENSGSLPDSPVAGQIYYNTTDDAVYFYDGSNWVSTASSPVFVDTYANLPDPTTEVVGTLGFATDKGTLYVITSAGSSQSWTQAGQAPTYVGAFAGFPDASVVPLGSFAVNTDTNPIEMYVSRLAGLVNVWSRVTVVLSDSAASNVGTASGSAGTGTDVSRADHSHGFVPAEDLSMAGYKLISVGDPTSAADAATKGYVDALVQGLDVKSPVATATDPATPITDDWDWAAGGTPAGTLFAAQTTGAKSIDGVALTVGMRVLVKDAAGFAYNGIYTVVDPGGAVAYATMYRSEDANTSAEVTTGMYVANTNNGTSWVLTTPDPITLDTTALTFTQFSSSGSVVAGDGIELTPAGASTEVAVLLDAMNPSGLEFRGGAGAPGALGVFLSASSPALGYSIGDFGLVVQVDGSTIEVNGSNQLGVMTDVFAKQYTSGLLGDGVTTSFTIIHNLNNNRPAVAVYLADVLVTGVNVTISTSDELVVAFNTAPASDDLVVSVIAQGS